MDKYNEIYPQLPKSDDQTFVSSPNTAFRLQKSCDALNEIKKELNHYEKTRKKYSRVRRIFINASIGTSAMSVILCGSGVTTSLTGLGAIIGVPLASLGGLFGVLSVCFTIGSKEISRNVSKHEQTVSLAKAKLNTISDIVSKALKDNEISDEEFSLVLSEVEKFETLKQSIRQKHQKKDEKNINISQIEKDIKAKLVKQLTAPAQ